VGRGKRSATKRWGRGREGRTGSQEARSSCEEDERVGRDGGHGEIGREMRSGGAGSKGD